MDVKRTERGWAGHFICANRCRFRRNTLLEYGDIKIVVSTVGLMETPWKEGTKFYSGPFETIGYLRHYETMAFHSDASDTRYHDADVTRPVDFDSPYRWFQPFRSIDIIDADDKANDMHEAVVKELTNKLKGGKIV